MSRDAPGVLIAEEIVKVFPDGTRAVDGVSFEAAPGRVLTLLGPSGCGKTTLLRIVAGLEDATSGRLTLSGEPLDRVPAGRRDVGLVFQSYALYPHLTVARNLSLSLEARKISRSEIRARVAETAGLLGIADLLERRPAQLSGGQQQRVALGRALVRRPRLTLLDEPLSNLDALLRESMRGELKRIFRSVATTVLYVTHDQTEALGLSDDLLVMKDGRATQRGAPLEVYRRPADLFTATFVGTPRMTVWRGRREGGSFVGAGPSVPAPDGLPGGPELALGMRPEDVVVASSGDGWAGTVELAEPLGDRVLLTIRLGGERLRALVPEDRNGDVRVSVPPARLHWFDAATEKRLEPKMPRGGGRSG
jgi:ABC-type sugar transport system ATPase subunit